MNKLTKILVTSAVVLGGCLVTTAPAAAAVFPIMNSLSNVGSLPVGAKTGTSGTVIQLQPGVAYLSVAAVVLTKNQCAEVYESDSTPVEYCSTGKTVSVPLGKGPWVVNRTQ